MEKKGLFGLIGILALLVIIGALLFQEKPKTTETPENLDGTEQASEGLEGEGDQQAEKQADTTEELSSQEEMGQQDTEGYAAKENVLPELQAEVAAFKKELENLKAQAQKPAPEVMTELEQQLAKIETDLSQIDESQAAEEKKQELTRNFEDLKAKYRKAIEGLPQEHKEETI